MTPSIQKLKDEARKRDKSVQVREHRGATSTEHGTWTGWHVEVDGDWSLITIIHEDRLTARRIALAAILALEVPKPRRLKRS